MPGERFTAWLGEDERSSLRAISKDQNVSANFIMRLALRSVLFGKPIPNWLKDAVREQQRGKNVV